MSDHKYYMNDSVEVCEKLNGNSSGYSIFYPAKIVLVNQRLKICNVSYETRFGADGEKLKGDLVKLVNVRPKPPEDDYKPGDVVDVFVHNAWWSDQTLRKLHCPCCSRMLDFSMTPKEKDANLGKVRPHYDWENGKWIKPVRPRCNPSPQTAGIPVPWPDVTTSRPQCNPSPLTAGTNPDPSIPRPEDATSRNLPTEISGSHQDATQTVQTTEAASHPSTSTVSTAPLPFTSSPQVQGRNSDLDN